MKTTNRHPFLFLTAVLAAVAMIALAVPQIGATQSTAAAPAGQRIFYASHSLMWDMPPVLQQQAEAYGIKGHTVLGMQRLGVSRTSQHWELADDRNEAKRALRAGNVDVFVMSPISSDTRHHR